MTTIAPKKRAFHTFETRRVRARIVEIGTVDETQVPFVVSGFELDCEGMKGDYLCGGWEAEELAAIARGEAEVIEGAANFTFEALREANVARLPEFKNAKGELSHSERDGSDWSLNDWMTALTGEVGEAANVLKKVRRGDLTLEEAQPLLRRELADIQTYLDILAFRCGFSLATATIEKFNEISERVGSSVRLSEMGYRMYRNKNHSKFLKEYLELEKSAEKGQHLEIIHGRMDLLFTELSDEERDYLNKRKSSKGENGDV